MIPLHVYGVLKNPLSYAFYTISEELSNESPIVGMA